MTKLQKWRTELCFPGVEEEMRWVGSGCTRAPCGDGNVLYLDSICVDILL